MANLPFDEVVELVLQLSPTEQARLMERLASAIDQADDGILIDEALKFEPNHVGKVKLRFVQRGATKPILSGKSDPDLYME